MDTRCTINRRIDITWKTWETIERSIALGMTPYVITPCPGHDGAGGRTGGLHDIVFEDDYDPMDHDLADGGVGRLVVCNNGCGWGSWARMHGTDPEDPSHFGLDPEWVANFQSLGPDTLYFWRDYRSDSSGQKQITHDRLPIIENGKVIWPIV